MIGSDPRIEPSPRSQPRAKVSRREPSPSRRRPRLAIEPLEGRIVLSSTSGPYVLQAELRPALVSEATSSGLADVALSAAGDVMAVGSPYARPADGGPSVGNVTIFARSGLDWVETASFWGGEPVAYSSMYAREVELSDDGSTLVVLESSEYVQDPARISIYQNIAGTWGIVQEVEMPRGGSASSAAVSADGRVIAVGSPGGGGEGSSWGPGLVRIFTQADGIWSQTDELLTPDVESGGGIGDSVALSDDGLTLAAGAPGLASVVGRGGVYVYRNGDGWGDPALIPSPWSSSFGSQVYLSGDGEHLLGQGGVSVSNEWRSTLHAFSLGEEGWASDSDVDLDGPLGWANSPSAALNYDGSKVVVGERIAIPADFYGGTRGAAYVLERDGSGWSELARLRAPGGIAADGFGLAVAIAGTTVAVAAPEFDSGGPRGRTFVFHEVTGFEVVSDPADLSTDVSAMATFRAAVAGVAMHSTQWQSSGDGGATWAEVPGATSDWYSFVANAADSGRLFRAAISDGETTLYTRAARLTVVQAAPVITIVASPSPSYYGEAATFTVDLSPPSPGMLSPSRGELTIEFGGRYYSYTWGQGAITLPVPAPMAPGEYTIRVEYDGARDPVYASASAQVSHEIRPGRAFVEGLPTVIEANAGTRVTLRGSIRIDPDPTVHSWAPLHGAVLIWDGDLLLGAVPITAVFQGQTAVDFAFTLPGLTSGGHQIRAEFRGDFYGGNPESRTTVGIRVLQTGVDIQVTPLFDSPLPFGREPTFRIRATANGVPVTGQIDARVNVPWDWGRTYQLDANGEAIVTARVLPPGGYVMTVARYADDGHWYSVGSAGFGIAKAATVTTLTASDPQPRQGQAVTFTATVADAGGVMNPTVGTMQFYIGGVLVWQTPVGMDGRARLTTTDLVAGTYSVTAVFLESQYFQASQSAPLSQAIRPAYGTATTLTSSRSPSTAGESLTFFAEVAGAEGAPGPTTGLVRFYVGLASIAEIAIDASGRAALPARFDAAGTYSMTAVYLGAPGFDTSQSAHVDQIVVPILAARADLTPVAATDETASPALTPPQARRAARAAWLARRRPPAARMR